ncbi:MAG TPA: universal stress protein [Blastocatellia bacterium]|nr:universal stress protein [Blastocatellia bacterium]
MRILLAIDGSSFSDAAVKEVAERPWPLGSELKIISVVEPPLLPTVETWVPPDNYYESLERAAEDQARATVEKAADIIGRAQGDHLRVMAEIIRGHPRHVITDEAEEWNADLIVVGSHGYRGLTRLWLGSVSQAVASHAKCSVEIVRSRKRNGDER